jgi:hypothetical protein
VDFIKQFSHIQLSSVVIHDFNLVSAVVVPHKTNAPLVIDANAVLPFSVVLQRLKVIARRNSQTDQFRDCLQQQQLAPRHPFDVSEPRHKLASEQGLGVGANERMDHGIILFRVTESVKQFTSLS